MVVPEELKPEVALQGRAGQGRAGEGREGGREPEVALFLPELYRAGLP